MPKGKVKEFDVNRGSGVIIDSDTEQPLTVYANYIKLQKGETLTEGQDVEYEIETSHHRKFAINVRLLLEPT